MLDARAHAVRRDLADVRLAGQVFAPHFAAPLAATVTRDAPLRLDRDKGSEIVAALAHGDAFEIMELTGDVAWGRAPGPGLVGYLDHDVLDVVG